MLDKLSPNRGAKRPRRRVGRGIGSGSGKTCGRGTKGQGARSGAKKRPWFEGGQIPLARRLPKRGFNNIFRDERQVVNVQALSGFAAGTDVDASALAEAGLVSNGSRPVKVLAEGEISVALKLRVNAISEGARKKVEAAGGSIELITSEKFLRKAKKS